MTPTISATALGRRYRDQVALDDVSLTVEPDSITGLLGRNGAGKTTLMRIVTGQEFPTAGDVRVFGEVPAENDAVLRRMVFVREEQTYPDLRVGHVIQVASWFYPNWSEELAQQLLADFELPLRRRIKKLSRGMRSAVGIVIGLAARAELTLFDEPYAGLDAVARQQFYDRLLADFAEHPRTVVLSTHLIDEAADLLEHVVMLDRGRVVLDATADDVRGTALLVVTLGVVYGLALTVLQIVERATGGWGLSLHFFRVPWIMDGPWYQTWLTSFVLLVLFFLYGMWYGLVFRRWSVVGLSTFVVAQMLVALAVVAVVSLTHHWTAFGHFFTSVQAPALTGVLAALTIALGLGGF